jgi:hypothetical protein
MRVRIPRRSLLRSQKLERAARRELYRYLHPPPGDDHAGHGGHFWVRPVCVSIAAGVRPAERRFSNDPGFRVASRCEPRDDGVIRSDTARAAIQHDRRHRFNDIVERDWNDERHHSIRSQPRHRCGRAGCTIRHFRGCAIAAAGSSEPAVVQEGQSGGFADSLPGSHLPHPQTSTPRRCWLSAFRPHPVSHKSAFSGHRNTRFA